MTALEIWGGLECTVNRVGDAYFDQLEQLGHSGRTDDIERFAELGLKTLRYPVLWERTAPNGLNKINWSWADERLGRLRELGIRPILGLVHHGSGPPETSLTDPGFADGLAEYAHAIAQRYPWIEDYTPVNEPVTTARFSALYGHWYPHGRDARTFTRALVTQCLAIKRAMETIRTIVPHARLVQTEDMGRIFSTPHLEYQAVHENDRRWLAFDLLFGCVDSSHPLWGTVLGWGAHERELQEFLETPCPPDIVGINYYLTSDRLLDERFDRYPAWTHGHNGLQAYADIEAVRAWGPGIVGHAALLVESWNRYHAPVAITEVHLGCSREDQMRWLAEAWEGALAARDLGANVLAVTVWSLLGSEGWDQLVARSGRYESGVFDVRGGSPRPTALAAMVRTLSTGKRYSHPVLATPGWWRRESRVLYPVVNPDTAVMNTINSAQPKEEVEKIILITGSTGTLGQAFARICSHRGLPYRLLTRGEMDIAETASVSHMLDAIQPWALINAAGYVRVDEAEHDRWRCHRENTIGPTELAKACASRNIAFLTFSSDLVFGGPRSLPYRESDQVGPLNMYGRSKVEAERYVLEVLPSALVIRTSAFFGPWDRHNFLTSALETLIEERPLRAARDTVMSPTYVPDLVHASLDLLLDGEHGLWHLANQGAISWADLARLVAKLAQLDTSLVHDCDTASLSGAAPRPAYSALTSERGLLLPSLDDSVLRFLQERDVTVCVST
jgi:dTDP-4-dehydrorhamnose reductase